MFLIYEGINKAKNFLVIALKVMNFVKVELDCLKKLVKCFLNF